MIKPKLFIGSSIEGLSVAYSIQENLKFITEVTVWDQGVFNLSEFILESLVKILDTSDYGIFVFTPDDHVKIRGKKDLVVRDNVLFELGLFVGKLGRNRAFIVMPDNKDFHLPTDLLGITSGKYEANRTDNNMQAATGSFCNKVREAIQKQGPLKVSSEAPETYPEVVKAIKIEENDIFTLLFIKNDYNKARLALKKKIRYTKNKNKKIDLRIQLCYAEFKIDSSKGNLEFEKLITEYPSDESPYLYYANNLYWSNSYKKSLEVIEHGLVRLGSITSLVNLKADCLWGMNKKNEAIETLKAALSSNTHPNLILKLVTFYENIDKKNAINLLHFAYAIHPDNEILKHRFARVAYDYNEKELALLLLTELISSNSKKSDYWALLGNVYLDFDLYNISLEAYEKAAELSNHKESWIYENIGNLYNRKQLYNKAEENLKKALLLNEKSDYTHSRLASVYVAKESEKRKIDELKNNAKAKIGSDKLVQ